MDIEPTHIFEDDSDSTPPTLPFQEKADGVLVSTTISDTDSLLNKRIGNFEILAVLGRGGFGAVYKARDTKLSRLVAIKFLHNPLDPNRRLLFEREARALAALSKEAAIVEVYEWGELGTQSYIVLEYLEGSAEDLLRHNPNGIAMASAVAIVADCAEALHAAHTAGILHRDMKPANILLENIEDGEERMKAKVADFGLAHLADESGDFTLAGSLSGSPPYMSPEQACSAVLDGRSDIFSLGVAFYELLCGERPFVGESSSQTMEKIRRNEKIPLGERRPDLPDIVQKIVEQATAHEPGNRYQTAIEFARALRGLEAALDDEALSDTRSRNIESVKRPVRFGLVHRWVAAVAVIIVLASVALYRNQRPRAELSDSGALSPAAASLLFSEARSAFEAERYAEAKAVLDSLDPDALPGGHTLVTAYLKEIERKTEAEVEDSTLLRARRLGEILQTRKSKTSAWDGWTSRRLSFFLLPTRHENSSYLEENGLTEVFDAALDTVYSEITWLDYLDRKNLDLITREMELSADLSSDQAGLALGQFIGARIMIGTSLRRFGQNAPERLYVNITDTESSKRVPADQLEVASYAEPEALLAALQGQILDALSSAYPLQGRLYRDGDKAFINIGTEVGLSKGMRFDVRRNRNQRPEPEGVVIVAPEPDRETAEVLLEGISTEDLSDGPESGWYVRIVESGASHGAA